MNIRVDFDNIVVKEDKNDFNVKVLMLKGEKGDKGDGEANVIEKVQVNGTNLPVTNKTVNVPVPIVDSTLSSSSTNPVQNNTIYNALSNKADTSALDNYYEVSEIDALLDKKIYQFNNVAEMKAFNLSAGNMAITKGYYNVNDSKGASYLIRNKNESDIVDNVSIIEINNTLVAELIIEDNVNRELYLVSSFDVDGGIDNYLYVSSNGITFRRLSQKPWGQLRDVDIIYMNNRFYAISTQTSGDLSIGDLYVSDDLENWERKPLYLDLGQTNPNYRNYPCDWFIDDDGKVYLSGSYQVGTMTDTSTSNTYRDFRLYTVEVTNVDFDNFTFGTPNILSNFDYNLIDPHITKKNSTYYMFAKKEASDGTYTGGTIQTFTSTDMITWTKLSNTISTLSGYKYEAPSIAMIDNKYYMYVDNFGGDNGSYMQYCTSDDLINWSKPSILQSGGYPIRHGTVRKIENIKAQKIILSLKNKNDLDYINTNRKTIVLPSIKSNFFNKYIKIASIEVLENYKSLNIEFTLKDIQNNAFDSEYKISITVSSTTKVNIIEKSRTDYTDVNKLKVVDIGDNTFEIYYCTLNISACTPAFVINSIIGSACNINFIENMTIEDTISSGTQYSAVVGLDNPITSQTFRTKNINTNGTKTSITATFKNKRSWQSFSCIIFGRFNCILFQAQINGSGNFTGHRAFDLTGQGKTYTLTTDTNSITIDGLDTYNEYTLLINDITYNQIEFE